MRTIPVHRIVALAVTTIGHDITMRNLSIYNSNYTRRNGHSIFQLSDKLKINFPASSQIEFKICRNGYTLNETNSVWFLVNAVEYMGINCMNV